MRRPILNSPFCNLEDVKCSVMKRNNFLVNILSNTVVWEKFGVKFFCRRPGTTKIKHTKIFLPQINREVYNGLKLAKTKNLYHEFFLMNISNCEFIPTYCTYGSLYYRLYYNENVNTTGFAADKSN